MGFGENTAPKRHFFGPNRVVLAITLQIGSAVCSVGPFEKNRLSKVYMGKLHQRIFHLVGESPLANPF